MKVQVEHGTASSNAAVSIGLIVTELVINALKHAFIDDRAKGVIVVTYEVAETSWRLAVSDNGIGQAGRSVGQDNARIGHQHRRGAGQAA